MEECSHCSLYVLLSYCTIVHWLNSYYINLYSIVKLNLLFWVAQRNVFIGNSWDKTFVERIFYGCQLMVQPSYSLLWEQFVMLKSSKESFNFGEVFYCTTMPI